MNGNFEVTELGTANKINACKNEIKNLLDNKEEIVKDPNGFDKIFIALLNAHDVLNGNNKK